MAGSYNKVLLMGNLTRDVELKHLPSGSQQVANIGLAVNRKFRTQNGENREEVTYIDCEAWGRTAEVMAQYLSKGRPVFIEGRLKLDQWQDQQGNNRSKMRVVVENFQFVDSGGQGGGAGGGGGGGYQSQGGGGGYGGGAGGGAPAPENYSQVPPDDDIPF
ncbi:MAG: single-stranded DNA-binding protein [Planctomycetota bacterium]